MPAQYLLLRQMPRKSCDVIFIHDGKEEIKFSGGRWDARKFLKDLSLSVGWENIPAYCQKKTYRGRPGSTVLIT